MEDLPRRVAFQSKQNSKFLRFIPQKSQKVHGNLRFSGDGVVSPFTKFEVERAKNTKGSLVHIKCSYNNKYLRWETPNDLTISASADEPNESHCDWSCTLFEPIYVDLKKPTDGARFRHVQSMNYVFLWQSAEAFPTAGLYAGSADPNSESLVTFIDLDKLVILPKLVTFRGNNGLYLCSADGNDTKLYFSSHDPAAFHAANYALITDKGTVVIKPFAFTSSSDNANVWECYTDAIKRSNHKVIEENHLSPINTTTSNVPTYIQFEPIKVGDNKIALRYLYVNYPNPFCELSYEGGKAYLKSNGKTITEEAIFQISEAIIWREVYNVDYHLMYPKIYKHDPVVMSNVYAENSSSETSTQVLKFSIADTTTTTWRNSVSLKLGVKVKLEGGIPLIVEGDVKISSEFKGTYTWGEDNVTKGTLENAITVTVPARSRIKVSMVTTQVSCEIPFSYTQRDMLIDGEIVTYEMDDGIYTSSSSNFNFSIGKAESLE